jgi:hypothetical protein
MGSAHTRDRCRSWAIPAVVAISSCSPCPLRHSTRGHRRCTNGRVPEEMMRSTFFATSSPASAGARSLRPLAQQEADVAPFFPTDRLHVAPERSARPHGARGVRTAVCVRDGRFHDPRVIARDVGAGIMRTDIAGPSIVGFDPKLGIVTNGRTATMGQAKAQFVSNWEKCRSDST